ncbi:hypothetical protein PIB30_061362 [Stylosanthes scabra]|uniref:Uncharacterized protein n=1 Tax=Stylosanthes scabra TaxID=79078 RepID=A0ABU6TMX7_9FABA|nr:hypothetical protein [Stylosanthes scabra]
MEAIATQQQNISRASSSVLGEQNVRNVTTGQYPYGAPSFMRVLDLEATHTLEFPQNANIGACFLQQTAPPTPTWPHSHPTPPPASRPTPTPTAPTFPLSPSPDIAGAEFVTPPRVASRPVVSPHLVIIACLLARVAAAPLVKLVVTARQPASISPVLGFSQPTLCRGLRSSLVNEHQAVVDASKWGLLMILII